MLIRLGLGCVWKARKGSGFGYLFIYMDEIYDVSVGVLTVWFLVWTVWLPPGDQCGR